MTKEILATDVELARGMYDEGRRDEDIRASLLARGLNSAKAAIILDDLNHGRMTRTETAFLLGVRVADIRGHQASDTLTMRHPSVSSTKCPPQANTTRTGTWPFVFVFMLFASAFGYTYLHLGKNASTLRVDNARQEQGAR